MKRKITSIVCIATALGMSAQGSVIFSADFESNTAANTGSIVYTSSGQILTPLTIAPNPIHGNNVLLTDPTSQSSVATNFRLNPTTAAPLTGGQTATVSLDVAWRRTSGATKSHFVTGYDASDSIIFQFVLADLNQFSNNTGDDRQQPGYATSGGGSLGFLAGDIATGSAPGRFFWGSDATPFAFSGNSAHFDLTISENSWTVAGQRGANSFTTNSLSTFNGSTHTELAYVQVTGEAVAAGAYFDNFVIDGTPVPEPSSTALIGLGGVALILRRRT